MRRPLDEFFRNTSVYTFLEKEPLDCFRQVEKAWGPAFNSPADVMNNAWVNLLANLCQRMGTVEYFAREIETRSGDPILGNPPLIGALLVGHYGACKSVLDAAAIAIARLYDLGVRADGTGALLPDKQQDFRNQHFWNLLKGCDQEASDRYSKFQKVIGEIIETRDVTTHRRSPLVMTRLVRDAETNRYSIAGYTMKLNPLDALANTQSFGVLDHHYKWLPTLHAITITICEDFINKISVTYE